MKCPKCQYLGFETGHRCRHCGYDFSLLALADPPAGSAAGAAHATSGVADHPASRVRAAGPEPAAREEPRAAAVATVTPMLRHTEIESGPPLDLPLLAPAPNEPVVSAVPAPRAPLSVRRTPDRARPVPPALDRGGARLEPSTPAPRPGRADLPLSRPAPSSGARAPLVDGHASCGWRPRALAAAIDLGMLAALDLLVVYFTLRVAGAGPGDWRVLPLLPMAVFLGALALAYFSVFTTVGGQTIGKMATQIRVVTDQDAIVTPGHALVRSLAAVLSVATCGAAFAPALFGGGRALHDRIARTRVVSVRAPA